MQAGKLEATEYARKKHGTRVLPPTPANTVMPPRALHCCSASTQAGKLEATEYVRKKHGFALDATLACGDSGNDILMLSGAPLTVLQRHRRRLRLHLPCRPASPIEQLHAQTVSFARASSCSSVVPSGAVLHNDMWSHVDDEHQCCICQLEPCA